MPDSKMSPLPIAVLVSGGGTTLKNLLDRQASGELAVEFRLVVSSRSGVGGITFAEEAGIPWKVFPKRDFESAEAHSEAIFDACRSAGVELVVMGGYLEHLLIAADFANRVVNIHPSLIPAFSGKGYYGMRVHRAVVEYGAKISGCTVHFVDDEFDHGPIIAQSSVPVLPGDRPEDLQARVFEQECSLLPSVLQAMSEGRIQVEGRRVLLHPGE
ncbi:MAG: phosphoribosylglycinamide formyltransferase [Aureliella sp.]